MHLLREKENDSEAKRRCQKEYEPMASARDEKDKMQAIEEREQNRERTEYVRAKEDEIQVVERS